MDVHPFYKILQQRTPGLMEEKRASAVLLAFTVRRGAWQIVLEERSRKLHHQPGEICLPGGMVEPGETPAQAALRETCEELLIRPEQLTLWGPGDVLMTPGGHSIHPFLAGLRDYEGTFSEAEVHTTFTVPVQWLLDNPPKSYLTRTTTHPGEDFPYEAVPGGRDYPWRQGKWPVYFYPEYEGRLIWGLTAKMLYHTLQLVQQLGGLPSVPEE